MEAESDSGHADPEAPKTKGDGRAKMESGTGRQGAGVRAWGAGCWGGPGNRKTRQA